MLRRQAGTVLLACVDVAQLTLEEGSDRMDEAGEETEVREGSGAFSSMTCKSGAAVVSNIETESWQQRAIIIGVDIRDGGEGSGLPFNSTMRLLTVPSV